MKKFMILFYIIFLSFSVIGQTMIEMSNPNDADIVLLQVRDSSDADVIIYCAETRDEWEQWDCMWKIKSFGFSNFSFYLAQSESDSLFFTDSDVDNNDGIINTDGTINKIPIDGKVYFTHNKLIRGYRNNFHFDGIMIKKK